MAEPHFMPITSAVPSVMAMAQSAESVPSWPSSEPAESFDIGIHELRRMSEPSFTNANANVNGGNAQSLVAMAGTPAERPIVPTCASDWESRKRIIRELYMDQNMILNEVMEIMIARHRFKATQVFPRPSLIENKISRPRT